MHNEVLLFVAGSGVPSPLRKKKKKNNQEASENWEDKIKFCLFVFTAIYFHIVFSGYFSRL